MRMSRAVFYVTAGIEVDLFLSVRTSVYVLCRFIMCRYLRINITFAIYFTLYLEEDYTECYFWIKAHSEPTL